MSKTIRSKVRNYAYHSDLCGTVTAVTRGAMNRVARCGICDLVSSSSLTAMEVT
jgi:hypothetical protein